MEERGFTIIGDSSRFQATISEVGATLINLTVNNESVVLGYLTIEDYMADGGNYIGAVVGRYANRIYKGIYNLDDGPHKVTVSNMGNANHSSINGLHRKKYKTSSTKNPSKDVYVAEFSLLDDHKRPNEFPGDLAFNAELTLDVEYLAELINGEATPINMTSHTYFNLNKSKQKSISGTEVRFCSKKSLEVSEGALIPTGKVIGRAVAVFDSASPTILDNKGPTYDYCFIVSENEKLNRTDSMAVNNLVLVFEAHHPESKLILEVSTTEPSFVFYTGNNLFGRFEPRSGFCVEQGRYIDAINRDEWKGCVLLKRGETYSSKTQYRFKTSN
ncbi:AEL_HP2_G0025590.mRNA.1.CDS.1 [Saccharomyces cerevisiae]|nr:AEL_HP2_G0025590.mRNA.1.CDS.1 [Saccharomyces cerevisiae]CAI6459317.1 AEL_HP2_G0025590.mRNA.1.CDS.1 [Saccharomyces cerevisiae]